MMVDRGELFTKGQRLRFKGHPNNTYDRYIGFTATVIDFDPAPTNKIKGTRFRVQVVDFMNLEREPCASFVTGGFYECRWELDESPFDPTKPFNTRAGAAAMILSVSDDPERPITASVVLDGEPRVLTYRKDGHFYGDLQTALDLVNVE